MTHDGVDVSPVGALINFYGDFGPRSWIVHPYIGAGFGGKYVNVNVKNGFGDESSGGIAWDAQAGITLDLNDEFKLDAALRYDAVSALDWTLKTVGVFAGVRWNF
jgi:opacity protein-like surface antigen